MSIKDIPEKIKSFGENTVSPIVSNFKANFDIKEDIFIVFSIILVGLVGFGLGKLSALEKNRGSVEIIRSGPELVSALNLTTTTDVSSNGLLVGSKNGTKYHFPWCAGASQISEKNLIWFNSYEEAQKVGYSAASNCKGLQ
jgi:hypothetical protein